MRRPKIDFFALLHALTRHEVDFVVVGGVCGVLHGAAVTTWDLDIVHSRTETNIRRLIEALTEVDAYYREHISRRLRPKASDFDSPGHHLLMTSFGPLDVLGTIGSDRGYDDLLPHTTEVEIDALKVRLLQLDMLIRTKEESGRDKDKAVLPILRQTLKEMRKCE